MLGASVLIIYWLQPSTPILHLDFWLPSASLSLVIICWVISRSKDERLQRADLFTGLIVALLVILIGSGRYLGKLCCLTPTPPPALHQIIIASASMAIFLLLLTRVRVYQSSWMIGIGILILALFIIIKSEPLARLASMGLRSANAQAISLASALDIRWLGFSYIAFRLLHTIKDRLSGRLPGLTLQEYLIFVIFFPAITAGPIDRAQRFVQDLNKPYLLSMGGVIQGGKRIMFGIFSKFVIADGLAIIALNDANAAQVNATGWLWVMLYAFALRIFFDFAGYTDIAIGLGNILGIDLPENFDKPYIKPNLTMFWNSWHMTLAGWFRAYFFNPLTRALRSRYTSFPMPLIIFIGQLSTFILIGLWHGISWNFAIWGAWHGVGLFIHNRWSTLVRVNPLSLEGHPLLNKLLGTASAIITFHYVSLGWVWFVLSTPEGSWNTLQRLFGIG